MKLTHSTSAVTGSHIPTIHVTAQSMTGQYHAVRSQENEDSIIKFENDSIMVVAVSDGCSESAGAKAASQASCEASVKFAKTRDVWSTDDNTLKSAFLSVIDDVYMDTKLPYNLLKATLLLLVVSKITGDYVGISIGDCSALVLDENLNKPEVLLKPYNQFMQATRTVFANNKDGCHAIVRGRVQDKADFVLCCSQTAQRRCWRIPTKRRSRSWWGSPPSMPEKRHRPRRTCSPIRSSREDTMTYPSSR